MSSWQTPMTHCRAAKRNVKLSRQTAIENININILETLVIFKFAATEINDVQHATAHCYAATRNLKMSGTQRLKIPIQILKKKFQKYKNYSVTNILTCCLNPHLNIQFGRKTDMKNQHILKNLKTTRSDRCDQPNYTNFSYPRLFLHTFHKTFLSHLQWHQNRHFQRRACNQVHTFLRFSNLNATRIQQTLLLLRGEKDIGKQFSRLLTESDDFLMRLPLRR